MDEQITITVENCAALLERPMLAIPEAVRPSVLTFWLAHQNVMPTPLPLTIAIARDMRELGLQVDDINQIFRDMMTPAARQGYDFPAKILPDYSRRVNEAIQKRQWAERQKQWEESKKRAVDPEEQKKVKRMLSEYKNAEFPDSPTPGKEK